MNSENRWEFQQEVPVVDLRSAFIILRLQSGKKFSIARAFDITNEIVHICKYNPRFLEIRKFITQTGNNPSFIFLN